MSKPNPLEAKPGYLAVPTENCKEQCLKCAFFNKQGPVRGTECANAVCSEDDRVDKTESYFVPDKATQTSYELLERFDDERFDFDLYPKGKSANSDDAC